MEFPNVLWLNACVFFSHVFRSFETVTSLPVGFPIDIWCILKLQTLKSGEYFAGDFWGVHLSS